jgi:hypothetical protein
MALVIMNLRSMPIDIYKSLLGPHSLFKLKVRLLIQQRISTDDKFAMVDVQQLHPVQLLYNFRITRLIFLGVG